MAIPVDEPLFDAGLLPDVIHNIKGTPYRIRPLQRSDYDRKFLDCLADLTWIGDYSEEDFDERYQWLATKGKDWYYCIVADNGSEVVATATLIVERKFIHNRAMCGHVEEVVVSRSQQKTGLGFLIMDSLQTLAKNLGVKKVILNCSNENIPFYQKCGFQKAGQQMDVAFGVKDDSG